MSDMNESTTANPTNDVFFMRDLREITPDWHNLL